MPQVQLPLFHANRSALLCFAAALCSMGIMHSSEAAQAKPSIRTATAASATAKPAAAAKTRATAGPTDKALNAAQDRAVANYRRNQTREAAAEKLAQTRAAAARSAAAKNAKAEAQALARAQDRVVAHYKGIPLVAARRVEVLTCFTGIQDRHARIGVQLINGKVDNFSFYSKSKPRTCSIDVARNGAFNHWEDNGVVSRVTLMEDKGVLLIDRRPGGYRFVFRGVDRTRYCGMDGKINGSLTVLRGKSKCDVQGIMDGHQG